MENKYKIIIAAVALAVSFAFGRYTVSKTVMTETTTQAETDKQKDVHTIQTTVSTKTPDGSVKIITTTDTTTSTITTKKEDTRSESTTKSGTSSKLNVSALFAYNYKTPATPLYGISVSKEFIGPITAGLWGLNNGTVGVSVGVNF